MLRRNLAARISLPSIGRRITRLLRMSVVTGIRQTARPLPNSSAPLDMSIVRPSSTWIRRVERALRLACRAGIGLAAIGLALPAQATTPGLTLDGKLDDAIWHDAPVFDQFASFDPLTLEASPWRTEARVVALPEGLAVGIRAEVPRELRTYGRSPRDAARLDADPVRIVVDFEGTGRVAYEFTVSLSDSVRDGVILNQNQASYDWDGTWFHAVSEDDAAWYVEVLLPWTVAPSTAGDGDTRELGIWFARFVKRKAHGYGYPAISPSRPTFVADLHRIRVPRHPAHSFDVFPYVSGTHDRLERSTIGRAGLDFTWKPNGQNQLTAAIHPDFGQVESDDLVVNFTAIESFFSEKRPFFTENQSLFDLRTPTDGRLVNTRRIGAAPDGSTDGSSDLLGALKYSGLFGPWEVGAFGAFEDDHSDIQGRSYLASRARWRGEKFAAGWLGTWVDRPMRERRAQTHTLDADWYPGGATSLRGQLITSLVDAPGARDGAGAWLELKHDPGEGLAQDYELLWFDRHLDLNDLGFLPRANLRQLRTDFDLTRREFPADSLSLFTRWGLETTLRQNDFGQRLPATLRLEREWRFRRPFGITARLQYDSDGRDDLITRGHGPVQLPGRWLAGAYYSNAGSARGRVEADLEMRQEGASDRVAWQLTFSPQWFFTPNLGTTFSLIWLDSPDWLVYRPQTGELGSWTRRQAITRLSLSWYPGARSELRTRLQWIALRAGGRAAYRNAVDGALEPLGTVPGDFTRSQLALQVRYRYELAPLSEFFVVYSRGGFAAGGEADDGLGRLWSQALDATTADQFAVKLRYRF